MPETEGSKKTEKKTEKKTGAAKIAAIASTVLWILGFALAFVVPANSPFGWVPDGMLLVGFFPLLYAWKPGWPWVVFGVLNTIVGFLLLVAFYIPDTNFTADMIMVRKHLAEQHSPFTWMTIGIMSTIFGMVRMAVHLFQWIKAKSDKKDENAAN
ncbi:hypothetical protein BH10CYA1_BH10CYA1_12860 [soil metagenome]